MTIDKHIDQIGLMTRELERLRVQNRKLKFAIIILLIAGTLTWLGTIL